MTHPTPDRPSWAEEVRNEARRQWGDSPAGYHAAGEAKLGEPESFARIERDRYREQAWMHETFRFGRYGGCEVLEVGVGLGTDHVQFARGGAHMTGIDLMPRCIEMTRRRFALEGLRSDLHVMDAERLAFEADSFDVVYSFGVLHHAAYPARAFQEVRRVLRPGGIFLGGLYNRRSAFHLRLVTQALAARLRGEQPVAPMHMIEKSASGARPLVRLFTESQLRHMLQSVGFGEVAILRRHLGLGRYTERLPAGLERLGGRAAGWYLIHQAR